MELKTCHVHKSECVAHLPPQIARFLIELRGVKKTFARSLCLRRRTSCLASGRPLHRLIVHSSAEKLVQVQNVDALVLCCHWFTNSASLCRGGMLCFPNFTCFLSQLIVVPYVRLFSCIHLRDILVFLPSICTTFEIILVLLGNDASHSAILYLLD